MRTLLRKNSLLTGKFAGNLLILRQPADGLQSPGCQSYTALAGHRVNSVPWKFLCISQAQDDLDE